jgi:hypothetical protein
MPFRIAGTVLTVDGNGMAVSLWYRWCWYFQRQYPCASSIGSWYYAIMDVPSRQLLPTAVSLCQQYRELVLRHHGCTVEAVTSNGSIPVPAVSGAGTSSISIEMDLRDSKCNCKTPSSTARHLSLTASAHRYFGGKEGTRLRREVKKLTVTSHQSCNKSRRISGSSPACRNAESRPGNLEVSSVLLLGQLSVTARMRW